MSLGPIDTFMKDPDVTEIMINDLRNVMIEKEGQMSFSGLKFQKVDDLLNLSKKILLLAGRSAEHRYEYVDLSLPDGSRVNMVFPPLVSSGPCITIRKFPQKRLSIDDLMSRGMLDQRIAYFLNMCVVGKINILVSGGTGSGKTTLLNTLVSFIPKEERVITIEDTPELAVLHENSVRMFTRSPSSDSDGVSLHDLVINSLRMRPDRIIVGECRKAEAFDMLQAMNTGHLGSMTTIHANSTRDALSRLETLCLMGGPELPLRVVRKQISEAIDLVVYLKRGKDGIRRVYGVSELTGMEGEVYTFQDIFTFSESKGFTATGMVPAFVERLKEQGLELPQQFFG